jgi:uncharacterized protein (DUF433 family)
MNAAVRPHEFWRERLSVPNYRVSEAARYAHITDQTIRNWHKLGNRPSPLGSREPGKALSYLQLIELAVVAACRKAGMALPKIRASREYLSDEFRDPHPFATQKLLTDGVDLMMECGDELLATNLKGQLVWKKVIQDRLKEFVYLDDIAAQWHVAGSNSSVLIDPRVQFGRPSVRGIPTWIIAARHDAGEGIPAIARDFGIPRSMVADAFAFEGVDPEAAKAWSH